MFTLAEPKQFRENLRSKIKKIIKNEKIAINLEKGIYNYAIAKAKEKKIVRKWENKYFVQIYLNRFRSIYNNINPGNSTYNKSLLQKVKNKNKIS